MFSSFDTKIFRKSVKSYDYEQKVFHLQEEVTELHRQKGNLAQNVIDLNRVLQEKDTLLQSKSLKISELEECLKANQKQNHHLMDKVKELEETKELLTDEQASHLMAMKALETKNRQLEDDNLQLIKRVKSLQNTVERLKNIEYDIQYRKTQETIRKNLQDAVNSTIFVTDGDRLDKPLPCKSALPRNVAVKIDANESEVNSVRFTPSGHIFGSAGFDRKLRLWTFLNGKCEVHSTLVGCNAAVTAIDFDPNVDGYLLYSLSQYRNDLIFRKINPCLSVSEQGPFDVILHKIPEFLSRDYSSKGQKIIDDFINYAETNPDVIYIDHPASLKCLLTRFDQFCLLQDIIGTLDMKNEIFVPKFCLLLQNDPNKLCEIGISYPIVCKSIMAHGKDSVHKIAIVFNESGLDSLTYPIFVQQFIKHNGKVIKLFVIGDHSCVTEVPSIKNHDKSDRTPIFFHSHSVSKDACQSPLSELTLFDQQTSTPHDESLFNMLAQEIRKTLKIDLFGIDLVCATDDSTSNTLSKSNKYAIIDLNIFPSYKNVHGFLFYLENLIREKLSLPLLSNDSNDVQK
ncbi:unnamed protein product [Schistosoma turkestanicum]|nr:unnamed protein product [Schistosoma turkestanicum]